MDDRQSVLTNFCRFCWRNHSGQWELSKQTETSCLCKTFYGPSSFQDLSRICSTSCQRTRSSQLLVFLDLSVLWTKYPGTSLHDELHGMMRNHAGVLHEVLLQMGYVEMQGRSIVQLKENICIMHIYFSLPRINSMNIFRCLFQSLWVMFFTKWLSTQSCASVFIH